MKVLISPNFDKPGGADCARRVIQKLLELGLTPMLDKESAAVMGAAQPGCVVDEFDILLAQCDIILTIGGDGTILHAVQKSLRGAKPLLGINTGRIGFLTQLEANELDKLDILRDKSYTMLNRMMLEITLVQDDSEQTYTALNEVVLSRGQSERLVEIAVTCDGNQVVTHRADGLIFATPTGSTAYNLSAGGPVVDPGLSLILMTAICPHPQFHHTMILSPTGLYEVREVPGNNESGLILSVDGNRVGVLRQGGHVLIRRSDAYAPFIDLRVRDFYHCVDIKLKAGK